MNARSRLTSASERDTIDPMRVFGFWLSVVALCVVELWATTAAAEVEEGRPVGRASPPPPADAVIAILPFERSNEPNRVFVNLAPEGNRPLTVMLDTGATFTVFTPLFARSIGVSVRRTKSTPYRRATRLGRDLQFYIDTTLSDSGSRTGWEYGVLGGNFLEQYVIELNFNTRRVTFLDPKKYRVPESVDAPNEAVVPLRIISRRPVVEIEMNGESISVLLDTGAPNPLILSGKAAKKLGVDVDSLEPFGVMGTTRGPTAVSLYETESFVFGGFAFDRMPVMVAPNGWYNIATSSDSAIGYDTLSQFTVRIDYPRERMWLRREDSTVTYLGVDYASTRETGLFMYSSQGNHFVTGVLPETAASRLGLQPGDLLTQRFGEKRISLEEAMALVVAGGPILVARKTTEDVWMDIVLPAGAELPDVTHPATQGGLSDEQQREQVVERDRAATEQWKQQKDQALYVFEHGGWMKVEERKRRKGPKEGEAWVSFDEMLRIKSEAGGGS